MFCSALDPLELCSFQVSALVSIAEMFVHKHFTQEGKKKIISVHLSFFYGRGKVRVIFIYA